MQVHVILSVVISAVGKIIYFPFKLENNMRSHPLFYAVANNPIDKLFKSNMRITIHDIYYTYKYGFNPKELA